MQGDGYLVGELSVSLLRLQGMMVLAVGHIMINRMVCEKVGLESGSSPTVTPRFSYAMIGLQP